MLPGQRAAYTARRILSRASSRTHPARSRGSADHKPQPAHGIIPYRLLQREPSRNANRWRVAAAVWIGLIFFSSTTTAGQWSEKAYEFLGSISSTYLKTDVTSSDVVHFLAEKSVHVFLFMVLAILLGKAIRSARCKFATILLIGSAVGSCSELLQQLFPGRDPTLRDVAINVAATAIGALICWFLFRSKRGAREDVSSTIPG